MEENDKNQQAAQQGKQTGSGQTQAPKPTPAVAKKDKDKIPLSPTTMPPAIFGLVGRVGAGVLGMREAKEELRAWVVGLAEEEKEQLKIDADGICRRLVLAAEGLSQELTTLVISL